MNTALIARRCFICEQLTIMIVDKDKWDTTKMSGRGEGSVIDTFKDLPSKERDQLVSGCHVPCLNKWFQEGRIR